PAHGLLPGGEGATHRRGAAGPGRGDGRAQPGEGTRAADASVAAPPRRAWAGITLTFGATRARPAGMDKAQPLVAAPWRKWLLQLSGTLQLAAGGVRWPT